MLIYLVLKRIIKELASKKYTARSILTNLKVEGNEK